MVKMQGADIQNIVVNIPLRVKASSAEASLLSLVCSRLTAEVVV